MIKLFPYQNDCVVQINARFQTDKNVLLALPTGSGKTTIFGHLVKQWASQSLRILSFAHRYELINQIHDRFGEFGVNAGKRLRHKHFDPKASVQVGMIKSAKAFKDFNPDIVIIDECHHSVANTYRELWKLFPNAKILGVTATPVRTDGKGFDDLFDIMIGQEYDMRYMIKNDYLAIPKHLLCTRVDLSNIKIIEGEYDFAEMAKIMRNENTLADVVSSYNSYAYGKQAIVFAVDVPHSIELADRFNSMGIPAAHIDGDILEDERDRLVKQFKNGQLKVLTNFNIVAEGFDVPSVEAVILAKRSTSLAWYLQAIGRGIRKFKGKQYGYILDCAGAWLDHGFAGISYQWNLEGKPIRQKTCVRPPQQNRTRGDRQIIETIGIDLYALNSEMEERALMYDIFVHECQKQKQPLSLARDKYLTWLEFQGVSLTELELDFIDSKIDDLLDVAA